MPIGPAGGPRPGSDSTLNLVIKEIPVVGTQPEGVFPEPLIRNGAFEEDIIKDIASRTEFNEGDISIEITNKFQRGLGQTDTYDIDVNVSGMRPEKVATAVNQLTSDGYLFEIVEFK